MPRTPDQLVRDLDAFLDDALCHLEHKAALDLHRRLFLLFHDRFYKHLRSTEHASTMGGTTDQDPSHC